MDADDVLLIAGITLFLLMLLRIALMRKSRRRQPETFAKTSADSASAGRRESEMEVRLHQTFREMSGILDTKIRVLNELIIEANAAIEELKSLRERSPEQDLGAKPESDSDKKTSPDASETVSFHPIAPIAAHADSEDEPAGKQTGERGDGPDPHPKAVYDVDEPLVIEVDRSDERRRDERRDAASPDALPPATADASSSAFADVYGLADEGHDSLEISRRTGKPVGEVELILGLRRRRRDAVSRRRGNSGLA